MSTTPHLSPAALCFYSVLTLAVPMLMDAENRGRQLVEYAEKVPPVMQQVGQWSGLTALNTWQRRIIDSLSEEHLLASDIEEEAWELPEKSDAAAGEETVDEAGDAAPAEAETDSTPAEEPPADKPADDTDTVAPAPPADDAPAPADEEPLPDSSGLSHDVSSAMEGTNQAGPDIQEPPALDFDPLNPEEPVVRNSPAVVTEGETPEEPAADAPAEDSADAGSDALPTEEPTPAEPSVAETDGAQPAAPVADMTDKRPVRCRIMLVGDSMMEGFGPVMHRDMRAQHGLDFVLTAKFSTGLCVPKFFNWPEQLEQAVQDNKPDIVIFFMGANDAMPMNNGEKGVAPGTPDWHEEYVKRAMKMTEIAQRSHALVMWVGLPIMGGKYAALQHKTTEAIRDAAGRSGVPYVDSEPVLADANGQFSSFGRNINGKEVRLRRKDKEHMTYDGDLMLVRNAQPTLRKLLAQFRAEHPERILPDSVTEKPYSAPLKITIKYVPPKRKK